MSNSMIVSMPVASTYGAVEIKEFIRKNTYRALVITLSLLLLLLLIYFVYGKATATKSGPLLRAPISKLTIQDISQQTEETEEAPPPPSTQQVIDYATAARAGTPVPVPDAQIKEDLKDFANVEDLNKSLAKNEGQIVDLNSIPNFDPDQNMNVKKEEEIPDSEEFIAVEKDPQVDLGELQKKVVYPEMARKSGVEGQVIVRVLVGKDGRVKQTKIQHSESSMLDQAAIDAVKKSIFTPAIQNGQPITCWVSIPIKFRLR